MRLKAGCEMTLQAETPSPLIAMLRPRSGEAQWIVSELFDFEPFVKAVEYVDGFGNLCQRLIAPTKGLRVRTELVVEVDDEIAVHPGGRPTPPETLPDYALQFLLPSRYCPSDTLESLGEPSATPGCDAR